MGLDDRVRAIPPGEKFSGVIITFTLIISTSVEGT